MAENEALRRIAAMVDLASESLFNAVRYCYLIADNDFYNINVKDIFRIGLSDITNPDCFKNLGIALDETRIGEMGTEHYREILSILRYCFAIRLPFIRKYAENSTLKEGHIKNIYDILENYGFLNPDGIVEDSFKSMAWMVRTKKTEPAFDTEWFRRWIYTYGHELAAINNRNMFVLGCVEALFPLYYASLQELLVNEMNKL
ncbi:MAG: hypothetical protein IKK53_04710 [Ruminiclostridium sp.]|nr:hypothetical protein [Ruminiclostridium sp.]